MLRRISQRLISEPQPSPAVLRECADQLVRALPSENHEHVGFYWSVSMFCNKFAGYAFTDPPFWQQLGDVLIGVLTQTQQQQRQQHHKQQEASGSSSAVEIRWLALILNSYARVDFRHERLMEVAASVLLQRTAPSFEGTDVSQLCSAFARLSPPLTSPHAPKYLRQLCDGLAVAAMRHVAELSAQGIANIVNAYARLEAFHHDLFVALETAAMDKLDSFGPQEMANALNGYAKFADSRPEVKSPRLFDAFGDRIAARLREFKPPELVMVVNAYAKVGFHRRRLFDRLDERLPEVVGHLNGRELSILANGYARFWRRCDALFDQISVRLLSADHSQQADILRPSVCSGMNLALLLHSYGRLAIRHRGVISVLVTHIDRRLYELDSRNLAHVLVSLAKLDWRCPEAMKSRLVAAVEGQLGVCKKSHHHQPQQHQQRQGHEGMVDLGMVSVTHALLHPYYYDPGLVAVLLEELHRRRAMSASFVHQMYVCLSLVTHSPPSTTPAASTLSALTSLLDRVEAAHQRNPDCFALRPSSLQDAVQEAIPRWCGGFVQEGIAGPYVLDLVGPPLSLLERGLVEHCSTAEGDGVTGWEQKRGTERGGGELPQWAAAEEGQAVM